MVAQRQYGAWWTVDQYLEMERHSNVRHEFIDGRVYAMAGGDQRHSRIGINVGAALADRLEGPACQVFTTDMQVRLANERDFVYPDAAVTCDPRDLDNDRATFIRYPRLIVEVLSSSTREYDRGDKFDLYRGRDTLREYVLVETERMAIEVRRREDEHTWITETYGPGDIVILADLDLAIPIEAFYRGILLV